MMVQETTVACVCVCCVGEPVSGIGRDEARYWHECCGKQDAIC